MATLRIVAPWRAISCVPENLLKSTNLPLSAVRGGTIVQPWMRAAPLAPSQRGKRLGDRGGWERRWSSPATIFPTNPPLSDPHGRKVCRRPQVPGPRPRRLSTLTVLPSYRLRSYTHGSIGTSMMVGRSRSAANWISRTSASGESTRTPGIPYALARSR
jgi:hypothetical protein